MSSSAPLPLWPIFRGETYDPSDEENIDDGVDSEFDSDSDSDSDSDCDFDCDSDEEIDRIEQQIDRRNRLFKVDEDGDLVWHLNFSAYTKKEWQRRGRFTSRATYDSSSPAELKQYIKNRMLTDPYPKGLTLKYFYLRILDHADEEILFPFLRLIPELRSMVYKELLTFVTCPNCPAVHEPCHPAILRTCKEIYEEAKAMLYANNEVHCRFTATGSTNGYSPAQFFSSIHGREITSKKGDGLDSLFYGMKLIPDYLRKIRHLHVDVVFNGGAMTSARPSLQNCLLNLASFLMDNHCLKKLRLHIYDMAPDDVDYTTQLDAIVYPLRRLRGIDEVELTGISDASKIAIISDLKSTASTFNTVQQMYQLQQEAEGYLCMEGALDPYNGESWDDVGPPPRGWNLSDDILRLDRELGDFGEMDEEYNAFLDAETELNTRRKMEDLKDCLDKVNLETVNRRRKEYLNVKRRRAEYLATSEWVAPEGTFPVARGIRCNWEPRLNEEDVW